MTSSGPENGSESTSTGSENVSEKTSSGSVDYLFNVSVFSTSRPSGSVHESESTSTESPVTVTAESLCQILFILHN